MKDIFNPHSGEWLLNKWDIYRDLRSRPQAYWSDTYDMYIITRYDDVLFALSNPEIFSSANGNLLIEEPERLGNTLGASDDPVHNDYKNIIKEAYSKKNLDRVSNFFVEKQIELLKDVRGPINISDVIEHISAWAQAEMLNMPWDKAYIKDLIFDIQRRSTSAVRYDTDDASTYRYRMLFNMLADLLKTPAPGPGVHHEYVTNNPKNISLFAAWGGHSLSGPSSLSGALQFLTLDLYREGVLEQVYNDRSLIGDAINESLRFHASTGRFRRTTTQDIHMHGVDIKKGTKVCLAYESANRDSAKFHDPDTFILNRNTSGQLAFGH